MASDRSFVSYICDQAGVAGQISYRKMFGEYAIYYRRKVVALVCRNQLFVKPTPGGKTVVGTCVEASPYPGAKPHYLITDRLDDRDWLSWLIARTAHELPEPKLTKPGTARKRK
jgi:TfoX/Sxy family transcriptional regulator of competence genes